jgi:tRNA(Ile)-lysidine synthetase-like protein
MNKKPVYIVAVSGGVDSVVLLHKLVSRLTMNDIYAPIYVVAHFNHGIRNDTEIDKDLVQNLADKYELEFEYSEGKLGPGASEATAREARYKFLRSVKAKHNADKIITAHHQDDVLETMVLNLIRGTGPRGLSPMQNQNDVIRPLINRKKTELIEYAKENNLVWHEDSTNNDENYLRNYVRLNIMPKLELAREELLDIYKNVGDIYQDVDIRIQTLLPAKNILSRVWFVGLPFSVEKELIRAWLIKFGILDIDSAMIERLTVSVKTLPIGKKTDISGKLWLVSEKQNVLITSK